MDLLARIDHWGEIAPERPAHVSEGRTLTYGELRAQSDALAAWLTEKLGDNRDPIAVIGHKENEMLVAFLGAVKSGHPYVPIDLSIPAQRAERIVQNANAALTLTPAAVREALETPCAELQEAINKAVLAAVREKIIPTRDVRIEIDPKSGEVKAYAKFCVVQEVRNVREELPLDVARGCRAPDVQIGEEREFEVTPEVVCATAEFRVVEKVEDADKEIALEVVRKFSPDSQLGEVMTLPAPHEEFQHFTARIRKQAMREYLQQKDQVAKPKSVSGEDPYYIIFTSGSTGEPKGVVITLNCLATFVTWTLGEQKFPDLNETFLNQAPFSFDLSVMDLYSSLASGGTLFSVTKEAIANPKALYQAFANSGITTWVSTPSFAQMCLVEKSFGPAMLPSIRRFWFCGETLAPETASQLLDRFPNAEVWNTYGPTEATVATTSILVTREVIGQHSPLPVGAVMPGTRIAILDEQRASVPEGERGEIVIIGPNVSPGYLGRPDLTEKAFFATDGTRAYRTGDWGRIRDGLVFFEGRMDGQIKLHGYRIEIGDIESHLRNLPQISDAVVLVAEKNGKPDSLAGFVVLRERGAGSDFEISLQLKKQLGDRLPAYMVPRKLWFLDAFPMTANGKADRRKLAEHLR